MVAQSKQVTQSQRLYDTDYHLWLIDHFPAAPIANLETVLDETWLPLTEDQYRGPEL